MDRVEGYTVVSQEVIYTSIPEMPYLWMSWPRWRGFITTRCARSGSWGKYLESLDKADHAALGRAIYRGWSRWVGYRSRKNRNMEPLIATEQAAQGGGKDIAKMGKRVPKARPHTLVEEDLVGVREAVRELDYKVEALDTKIDTVETALTTKIDTVAAELTTKIDTVATELNIKLEGVGKGIGEMKSWVKWGVIVGVGFMTGLLVIIGIVVSKLG